LNIEGKLFTEELINNFNLLRDGRRNQLLDLGYTPHMPKVQLEILELEESFWCDSRRVQLRSRV
jgi:hypothetical protein